VTQPPGPPPPPPSFGPPPPPGPHPSFGSPPVYPPPAPRSIGLWRRWSARFIDWLLVGTLAALVCWPITSHVLVDAAERRGTSFAWDVVNGSSDLSGSAAEFVDYARTIILLTLIGQVLIVAVYEWLGLAFTGTTVGKAILGIQVVARDADGTPVPRGRRLARLGVRSALVVLPGGLGVSFFAVAVIGVGSGWVLGIVCLAWALADCLVTRPTPDGRQCLHDRAGTTVVVSRKLAELASAAADQARVASAQAASMAQQAWNSEAAARGRAQLEQARQSELAQRATRRGRESWDRTRPRPLANAPRPPLGYRTVARRPSLSSSHPTVR
jgi:hypothetical protein